jgi:ATP-binding cassette, subfamily B, bacterial HlyB/CyaB
MTVTNTKIHDFFTELIPFSSLSEAELDRLTARAEFLRYRMGQTVLMREQLPAHVTWVFSGQVRLLAYNIQTQMPITLQLLEKGEMLGWAGTVRGTSCETAIASTEAVCVTIPVEDVKKFVADRPQLESYFQYSTSTIEVYELLGAAIKDRPDRDALMKACGATDLKDLTLKLAPFAVVRNIAPGRFLIDELDETRSWLVSSGTIRDYPVGSCIDPREETMGAELEIARPQSARLIGVPSLNVDNLSGDLTSGFYSNSSFTTGFSPTGLGVPYAPDTPAAAPQRRLEESVGQGKRGRYPVVKGKGQQEATVACFKMLSKYFNTPFRKETIDRVVLSQMQRAGQVSLQACGAIAEMMGLNVQLVRLPAASIGRIQTPAMLAWQDTFAVVYEVSDKEVTVAIPELGLKRYKTSRFAEAWGEQGEILLVQRSKDTPTQKFGIGWFVPAIKKHRRVLIEVLIASLFVQLFGLANPLLTQFIIDKVIVQNAPDTLNLFGALLIVVAIVEAILTALRTNLFVDTTNRIDLSLGAEIIDHLLRLPLKYFERRPVGEISTRINELENIRQFLTGTALTVVLDAIFSVVYIIVMIYYSPLMTVVALATLPAFILLTIVAAPLVRTQLRVKSERNAEAQSYLVELLGGIQTVKAQNIELRSRWQWQNRYSKYVSAGFKTAMTSTTAGSISGFLNKLSNLLLLWVGASLVISTANSPNPFTLGQLIAFRIIAGYTTSPLLRLVQLWQNFQETALSLERLSDIIDTPQEVDEQNFSNIALPPIQGAVKFDGVSFTFPGTTGLQLNNVNLDFKAGEFVGIVGLSGSGKSTLMKLLPRLYDPKEGRILIDNYDINKIELYSLRRQIGYVLQDTLLFNGTIQENIALTNPDATSEEIIEAAKIAAAHEFIMTLPNGYNSRVGERGSALSGGQRQRIAIARTVLQRPRMLILDEATSALDYDSERQVCLNLADSFRDRTVFFITHRLSAIKGADSIVMMDKGLVVEKGTHEELMALKGRYYCLYEQQEFLS